jgi:ribose 5-phosphate isomerase A
MGPDTFENEMFRQKSQSSCSESEKDRKRALPEKIPFEQSLSAGKRAVAAKAVQEFVHDGMTVGVGSGSTCSFAVEELARKIRNHELNHIIVIPSNAEVKAHCLRAGIPKSSISYASDSDIHVMFDGADEIDINMNLLKGGHGSIAREKMMESCAQQVVILADESKLVKALGPGHPLPVEIFGWPWDSKRILKNIENLPSLRGCRGILRRGNIYSEVPDGQYPASTDNNHLIVDVYFNEEISDVGAASADLDGLIGVVEHGLFAGQATTILIGSSDPNKHVRVVGHYPIDPDIAEKPWWGNMKLGRPMHRETVDNRTPDLDREVCLLPREGEPLIVDEALLLYDGDVTEPMGVYTYGGYREYK